MDLPVAFADPPAEYGPVPFWWWTGERLTRERLAWQLDQLRAKGVLNAIVSYNHTPAGETVPGDPPLFSPEWWELFRWVVDYCKRHGMQIGFQDYTIINRRLQEIGRNTPDMRGAGSLRQTACRVTGPARASLRMEDGAEFVAALALRVIAGEILPDTAMDLADHFADGALHWEAPGGEWQVVLVFIRPNAFDPTHPHAGVKAIESLYAVFEQNCPGELGRTIGILFQDELDFFDQSGEGLPLWSPRVEAEFLARKGYSARPWLPALWHDLGPMTAKVRIDYNDVCVALMEERYFRPIFEWCEQRGILLGNDNCGRGDMGTGHRFYGDAFRTMRWYGAPGNDDPGPKRGYAFRGFKVNSSIAHLYGRRRVWNEASHSSGWGFAPADIVAGFNEDCVYGATLFNLHGLYYTTRGGWWEWAPPDFHFRQPYWAQTGALSGYVRRTCFLLSQGAHRCDVAIVYPVTTIEAGMHATEAEAHAFGLGRHLFDAGIDFDFVDDESIERAAVRDDEFQVAGGGYRVMIFPMMAAVRWSTLVKAREFARAGGVVIAFGCLPQASERAGSRDPELDTLVAEIWHGGAGVFVPEDYEAVKRLIDRRIVRDFVPSIEGVFGLHRRIGGRDVYFVFHHGDTAREAEIVCRASGGVEEWDAWNGSKKPLPGIPVDGQGTRVRVALEPGEAKRLVFDPSVPPGPPSILETRALATVLELDGAWGFELVPTMDNRFGDFRLPATESCLGAEARRFRYREEDPAAGAAGWTSPDFDDADWEEVTYSFGPRFWRLGPLPPGIDTAALETALRRGFDPASPPRIEGIGTSWEPIRFSLRWGIENDPFLKDTMSGPHGLKGRVPDDFIDLGAGPEGGVCYLWTTVQCAQERTAAFVMGSRSEYAAWLNGAPVLAQPEALPPGVYPMWNLPHYDSPQRWAEVDLRAGDNLLLLKFVMPAGQRMRAYAVFDPPAAAAGRDALALRWFVGPSAWNFNYRPGRAVRAGWYRFTSPPSLAAMDIAARGPIHVWVDGRECRVTCVGEDRFRVTVARPALGCSTIAVRVEQPPDSFGGDALPEPVLFRCAAGEAPLGDWDKLGLAAYSGGAWYRKTFALTKAQAADERLVLQLGEVAAAAEVRINGRLAARKIAPPWRVELFGWAQEGENTLEILVMNTLANHYSVGIPSPYVFPGQTVSGLFGPVRILGAAPD